MPRGFLVKRTKNTAAFSYRIRNSDDSDSDHEHIQTNFGSPDSGYSPSPISLTPRERDMHAFDRDPATPNSMLSSSPISNYPSPHYFYAFDRLSVSNCSPVNLTPIKNEPNTTALSSPNKRRGTAEAEKKVKTPKKPKACRKINFDEDKTSPVSGTIIKDVSDTEDEGHVVCGDIDSAFNYVEITPEAKAELDKIENKIGDYVCQLCKEYYDDAFQLARHRCSRIVHVEYRCPECDKVFNCPANLASHRRWHKPKNTPEKKTAPTHIVPANVPTVSINNAVNSNGNEPMDESSDKCDSPRELLPSPPESPDYQISNQRQQHQFFGSTSPSSNSSSPASSECLNNAEEGQFECEICFKRFRRQAYLKKHILNHNNDRAKQQQPHHQLQIQNPLQNRTQNDSPESAQNYISHHRHPLHNQLQRLGSHTTTDSNGNKEQVVVVGNTTVPVAGSVVCSVGDGNDVDVGDCNAAVTSAGNGPILSCEQCNSSFSTKTALEKHARTHTGEVFSCKYCSSRFYSSPGLTRHINKCHPSENRQVILLQLTPVSRTC